MKHLETMKVITAQTSQYTPERTIGALLIDAGKISAEEAKRVLRQQKETGLRFGDAAIKLGIVKPDDIQAVLSKQFEYPYLSPGEGDVSPEVIAAWNPFSRQVESLRALRSQLLIRWFNSDEQKRTTLAVVGMERGVGRSYLVANLAVVFSQLGERTVLIDADLRHPRQHELFGLQNVRGLSTVLSGRAGADGIQRVPAFVDLSVLPAGPIPPNPSELIGREAFSALVEELAHQFDVVLFDTPAGVSGSDALAVTAQAHGALVVARKNISRIEEIAGLSASLATAHTTVVGGVLNEF